MADITVTAANVEATSDTKTEVVQYGATITAGQSLYYDTADSKWKLADANASLTTAGADGLRVALTPGADGSYGVVAKDGFYDSGATVTEGEIYVVSATAGGIAPADDLATGWNCSIIGIGGPNNTIDLQLLVSGQTVP